MKTIFIIFILVLMPGLALAGVEIASPSEGETVGGIIPINVSYSGTEIWPVYYLWCSVGGEYWISPPVLSGSHTFLRDTTYQQNGTQLKIDVHAKCAGSEYGSWDSVTVNVYNPPPVINITSPSNGQFILPEATTLSIITEYHNVEPNYHGIRWIGLLIDGWDYRWLEIPGDPTSGSYTWNLTASDLSLGEHTFKASCGDSSYKTSLSQEVKIIRGYPPDIHLKEQAPKDKITTVGEPINVANGNMSTSHTDIMISYGDTDLELSRAYNSQGDFIGQFGFGWRSNFDITLSEQPDLSIIEVDETGVYTIYTKNPDSTYAVSAGKYSVLTKNPDATFTLVRKHGKKLYFDTRGKLMKIESRNGNAINIARNADGGAILEVTDPAGRKLLFMNDAQGKVTQITDPANRVFKYEYDINGNLIKTTNPMNNIILYYYDGNHKLTQEIDPNNHSLHFEYDASDRAYHSWQDENNNEVTLSFDPANSKTTVTDSRDNATIYKYNIFGLVTKITDSQNKTQIIAWDSFMNKTSYTDQNSHTTAYSYGSRGNLLTLTDPLGNITTFTYEPSFDFVKTVTDAQNNVTTYDYDLKGNLININDALNHFTTNTYNNLGQITSTTNTRNYTTTFTYDAYGNMQTSTDSLRNITTFSYDILGNRTQIKDAKNNIAQFAYNSLNQLIQITYPDNSITTYAYDALGNKLSVTDNAGNTTNYTYDLNNKVTRITNPLGNTINFEYDTEGNRTKVIDQNLHQTIYAYDSLNRLVSETNPPTLVKSYTYDAVGNRISGTDAKDHTITYEYDALNRLKKINYPDASSVTFGYDSMGRRISMSDSQGATSYNYDLLNRLTQVDGPRENDTLQYTYDELGNRTSLILSDGKTIQYAHDAVNRITSITDSNNKATAYTYDEVGNLVNVNYPNNIQATYAFDVLNRLTRLTNQNQINQNKLSEFIYTYDSAGRRSRIESIDSVTDYTYDALGELTGEIMNSVSNPYQITYEYDPAGNRIRMLKNNTEHLYTYNNANQLTQENITGPAQIPITVTGTVTDVNGIRSLTVNGANTTPDNNSFTCQINLSPGANTITIVVTDVANNTATKTLNVTYAQTDQSLYLYDSNGNLIRRQSSTQGLNLSYDYENRLVNTASAGINISYGYNGEGKRISVTNGSNITNYLYDGMNVILERNGSDNPITSYLRNPYAAGGVGGIINSQQGMNPETYYSYDGLDSVVNLSDASGVAIQSYSYDAFGNLLTQANPNNTHQFLTKELDSSGFIYFGARYYNPAIGRFITPDPLGMIDGPNMYVYCLNDPVNLVDLWGWCGERPWEEKLQLYLTLVGAEMEKGKMTNMQGLIGLIGVSAGAYSNIGFIPKAIGYSNKDFLQGGRMAYQWANQYGNGVKFYSWTQAGAMGSLLSVISAGMTGWTVGETINAYYWGYQDYKSQCSN